MATLMSIIFSSILVVMVTHACPDIDYDVHFNLATHAQTGNHRAIQQFVPFSGKGCDRKGVIKIVLNRSGTANRRVLIDLVFRNNSSGFTFNLGGSRGNNGWGGDDGSTVHDAEIHSMSTNLLGYKSDVGGSGQAFSYSQFYSNRLTMIVGNNQIVFLPDKHNNFNYYDKPFMFDLNASNVLYLGMNRVISSASRRGSGLCQVGIKLLDQL